MNMLASIPFLKTRSKTFRQVISLSWNDRDKILDHDVNLFCWERHLNPVIHGSLLKILNKSPEPIQIKVDQISLDQSIELAKSLWSINSHRDGNLFWQDVSDIVFDFLSFSVSRSGIMHLRVVDHDACAKFHTDGYPLRLFTTYYGKGTEWLPEDAVNRRLLGKENTQIVRNESKIQSLGTGHVGILKGELPDPKRPVKGIVHRSPEISQQGEKRIILRVDVL